MCKPLFRNFYELLVVDLALAGGHEVGLSYVGTRINSMIFV